MGKPRGTKYYNKEQTTEFKNQKAEEIEDVINCH